MDGMDVLAASTKVYRYDFWFLRMAVLHLHVPTLQYWVSIRRGKARAYGYQRVVMRSHSEHLEHAEATHKVVNMCTQKTNVHVIHCQLLSNLLHYYTATSIPCVACLWSKRKVCLSFPSCL